MAFSSRFWAVAFAFSLGLAGCGGGGGGGSIPAKPGGATMGAAVLQFTIPAPGTSPSLLRRPNFLPSNTQSIVVTVFNADGSPLATPVQVIVNVSSCTPVSGGFQCTANVTVPFGALLFSIVAWSGPNATGMPLASATVLATIVAGAASTISATLGNTSLYLSTDLFGQPTNVSIDHQHGTFFTTNLTTGLGANGTVTLLPNGFEKFVVTGATDSTPLNSVVYVRESPNGGAMFGAAGLSPQANGSPSGSNADWGVATALESCPTGSGSTNANIVQIAGPTFPGSIATNAAFTNGVATLTSGSLSFSGTDYNYLGATIGPDSSPGSLTCTSGAFTATGQGVVAFDAQGLFVGANENPNAVTAVHNGAIGFRAPAQPYLLSDIASKTYDSIQGNTYAMSGIQLAYEEPGLATPSGGNIMNGCSYTNFESNVISTTNCVTITLSSEPLPGIVLGSITTPTSGTSSFVASVGQVNGKYMISILAVNSTGGSAVNIALMQH